MNAELIYEFHGRRCGPNCNHNIIDMVKDLDLNYSDYRKFIIEKTSPDVNCPKCGASANITNMNCPKCGNRLVEDKF